MTSHDISLEGVSVCLGIPSSRAIDALTVKSLFATQSICMRMGIPCQLAVVAGNAVVQWARDEVIDLFLQTDSDKLFMIDSDMVWEAEDFVRLLALSQVKDVVCASYTAKREQPTFYIRYDESKPLVMDEYGLVEIQGTGLGFTIINRKVIEDLVKFSDKIYDQIADREMASLFKIRNLNGNRQGEDMFFFERITDLGYKIYLDPSIELGHIGKKVYKGKVSEALNRIDSVETEKGS